MVKSYSGADRALQYLFDNAVEVAAAQIVSSGTPIATITIDDTPLTLYIPAYTPGSIVSFTADYNSGTKIGTITIDGTGVDIYIPAEKGITVSNGKVSLT